MQSCSRSTRYFRRILVFLSGLHLPSQAAMRDAEQPADIPLMGYLSELATLKQEYEMGNQTFVRQINYLIQKEGLLGIRRTRGDGTLLPLSDIRVNETSLMHTCLQATAFIAVRTILKCRHFADDPVSQRSRLPTSNVCSRPRKTIGSRQ